MVFVKFAVSLIDEAETSVPEVLYLKTVSPVILQSDNSGAIFTRENDICERDLITTLFVFGSIYEMLHI